VASEVGHGSTFSFTLPVYSLATLLFPVVTDQGWLRDAVALVKVELTPLPDIKRGNWKEMCEKSLDLLGRLRLPRQRSGASGQRESWPEREFIRAASTGLEGRKS